MSFALHGVGVSRGIAIGKAQILERRTLEVSLYSIEPGMLDTEITRLERALDVAKQELSGIRDQIPESTAAGIAAFIDTHILMLEDVTFTEEPVRIIRELGCNAEWALQLQRDAVVRVFDEMDDEYLRTRRDDVDHVVQRIQRILLQHEPVQQQLPEPGDADHIVVAGDLTPADTVLMEHHGIGAFVTQFGGPTSHTAILARSLGIPGLVGLHRSYRYVRQDDQVIVDGRNGVAIIDPDERTLAHYRRLQAEETHYQAGLRQLKEAPATTSDGHSIELYANVELPSDFQAVREVGAVGVGLYRTEFLFMNRRVMPDEEEQFAAYVAVMEALQGLPLTIRTLDLGADKQVDGGREQGPVAANPALGLRAVRLCLHDLELFTPQLRAIIRASAVGPVRMMIPMLSNVNETEQVLHLVRAEQEEFRARGVGFDEDMRIGGMIEVPAAAIIADAFADRLDFLSIGTNDLIQYAMAVDRVNDEVNYLYDPVHPAVLKLVHMTIEAGRRSNTPVAMCGEMAGDPRFVRLLLALGLREFSVHPAALLEVKRIVTESNITSLERYTDEILGCASGYEVNTILNSFN
jgi:phosphotransferase system enzyme I (PtsI)